MLLGVRSIGPKGIVSSGLAYLLAVDIYMLSFTSHTIHTAGIGSQIMQSSLKVPYVTEQEKDKSHLLYLMKC